MSPVQKDKLLLSVTACSAAVAAGMILLISALLVWESMLAVMTLGPAAYFQGTSWHPAAGDDPHFSLVPMLLASLAITGGAILLAGPAAVLCALYIAFYAPQSLRHPLQISLELLAGIPSIVFGFWGLVTLVPLIVRVAPPGQSLLAGILVVALMILPTIALICLNALNALPRELLLNAQALALGRGVYITRIALPGILPALVAGISLGCARAVGETMAVVLVTGNVVRMPNSLLVPVRAITSNIALEMGYATGIHRSSLYFSALLLILMVATLFLFAHFIRGRRLYGR